MNLSQYLPTLSPEHIAKLEQLADVFLNWNQKLNLSAIRDRDGVLLKHLIDSLLVLPFEPIRDGDKVLDMGTGGGFPGLALAVVYPDALFTLVDSTEKKVKAVAAMAKHLGLKNVRCLVGRAEELGRERNLREHFDVVVARAVAPFAVLLEYCLPFVRVGGRFIAYQGPEMAHGWQKYRSVARELGSEFGGVWNAVLPIENAQRCFIPVLKKTKLSAQYPRKTGIPRKNPLA